MAQASSPPRVFEAVPRQAFWIGIATIMAGLIALSWWGGLYEVDTATSDAEARVTTNDPMTEILYSPLGNAVVLLVLQFIAANLLFWPGVWLWLRVAGQR